MIQSNIERRIANDETKAQLSREELLSIISKLDKELRVYQTLYKRLKDRYDKRDRNDSWCFVS